MTRAAPSSPIQEEIRRAGFARMPKLLIIERNGEIQALLKERLSSCVFINTVPVANEISERVGDTTYDIVVWVPENSRSHKTKLPASLERLSKNSPHTQLLVISDREPEPVSCGLRSAANYQYVPQPI